MLTYPFKKESYKVEMSSMVLEAKYRFETSIWERDPFKFKTGDQNNKRANCLDLILTSTLSRKI